MDNPPPAAQKGVVRKYERDYTMLMADRNAQWENLPQPSIFTLGRWLFPGFQKAEIPWFMFFTFTCTLLNIQNGLKKDLPIVF